MKQSNPGESTRITVAGGNLAGWRQALGELALACAGSFPAEEAQRLRDMRRLLAAAPMPALLRGLAVPCAERVEELVRADAASTAALEMMAPDFGYLLSRGASGQHLASVILPGAEEETSASGDTMALALIGAIGLALVEAALIDGQHGLPDRRIRTRPGASRLN
jgi:hypothetical protein